MPKKRKAPDDEKPQSVQLPQTFRDITNLPNSDLNLILRQFGLTTRGKRNHKYTLIASELGIPTHDADAKDPFAQTLSDISSLGEGWTKDLRQVPEVLLDYIIKYLLAAHDISDAYNGNFENYTPATMKSYKALRSYDLWESGNLSSFLYNPLVDIEDFCALKCIANPSGDTSGTQYQVIVVLNRTGVPVGASCSCVAGLGEACTHIAGLLFGIEDFVSRGFKALPDSEATTDKLCKWIVPRGPKVEPKAIKSVDVKKNIPGKVKKKKVFRASHYDPLPAEQRDLDYDSLTQLHHTLSLSFPNLPWVKAVAPAIVKSNKPYSENAAVISGSSHTHTLPRIILDNNPLLVPASEISVTTNNDPVPLLERVKVKVTLESTDVIDIPAYSSGEKKQIQFLTRSQNNSVHWQKYRLGLVTASNFNRVASNMNVVGKTGPNNATNNLTEMLISGSSFKGNKATKYGLAEEPNAARAYAREMERNHVQCTTQLCGLVISDEHDFIGASPDRIFECRCHGRRLVEIKCPFTLTDKSRSFASLDFVSVSNDGLYTLKKTGNTYYDQIQGQMGVTGITRCDLVVWDGVSVKIISVPFDSDYWESLVNKVSDFHRRFVAPALVKKFTAQHVLGERHDIQLAVSAKTNKYPCGKCGQLLTECVIDDKDASINCECNCGCGLWFHWRCVHYRPEPDLLDEEPPWYCPRCVRNCDIVM